MGVANKEIKEKTADLFKRHRETNDENEKIFLENEIIEINFNLALHKTKRYRHTTIEDDDIIAAAIAGLFLAVQSYDYTKSAFSTFAGYVIDNEINAIFRKAGRQKRTALAPLSLNDVMYDGSPDTWIDRVVDETIQIESKFMNKQMFLELFAVCTTILDDIELTVLKNSLLPTGERKTQQELGVSLSRTQATVHRAEKRAVRKLRDYIVEQEWGLELLR